MSFDPMVFDQGLFGAESFSCVFDSAVFDGAVFDACVDAAEVPAAERIVHIGAGADAQSWQDAVQTRFDKLHTQLRTSVKERTQVVRKIALAKKKIEATPEKAEGILFSLHRLEARRDVLVRQIKDTRLEIKWIDLEFQDEDDEEILLLH